MQPPRLTGQEHIGGEGGRGRGGRGGGGVVRTNLEGRDNNNHLYFVLTCTVFSQFEKE